MKLRLLSPVGLLLMTVFLLMAGCKPSVPSRYLSQGKMEKILYDYHIAQAMAMQSKNPEQAAWIYRAAVLKKNKVTQAEFDSSLVYYTRHTELLHDIYEKLSDRLQSEAEAQGSSVSEMNAFGAQDLKGDTANLWTGTPAFVLSPDEPFNYLAFSFKADTAFHAGDRFILDFDSQFIFQDGMRDGVVVLAVQFSNDSVASTLVHVMNTQHYSLQVEDQARLGIKAVRGYFLMPDTDPNASATTLRLMFVQHLRLVRLHVKPVKPGQGMSSPGSSPSAAPSKTGPPQGAPQSPGIRSSSVPQPNGGSRPLGDGSPPGVPVQGGIQPVPVDRREITPIR